MNNFDDIIKTVSSFSISIVTKIIGALIVLIIGFKLINILSNMIAKNKFVMNIEHGFQTFLKSLVNISLKVLVVLTAASIIGIPLTSFITILGSIAVAIGLSLQGSLSNFAGGLIILAFKPFVIGDHIEVDGKEGDVTDIGIFYTVIKTFDYSKIVIPNSVVTNRLLVNRTIEKVRMVYLDISVAYDSDIEKVKRILLDIANRNELVLKEPKAPIARLNEHNKSSLNFTFRCCCKTEDYWDLKFSLLEEVKKEFDKNNIKIPYQQIDIHMDEIKQAL